MDRFDHFNDGRLRSSDVARRVNYRTGNRQRYFYRNLRWYHQPIATNARVINLIIIQHLVWQLKRLQLVHSPCKPSYVLDDINHVNRRTYRPLLPS